MGCAKQSHWGGLLAAQSYEVKVTYNFWGPTPTWQNFGSGTLTSVGLEGRTTAPLYLADYRAKEDYSPALGF